MRRSFIVSLLLLWVSISLPAASPAPAAEGAFFTRNLKKAESCDASAQYYVGTMYLTGAEGGRRDPKNAFIWYEKAAAQGHALATAGLAKLYEEGDGVERDYKKAFELYERAAMQGEETARSGLGKLYYFGRGCEKSMVKSYAYAGISESTDEASVKSVKSLFDGKLNAAELNEAKELAKKLRAQIEKNRENKDKDKNKK